MSGTFKWLATILAWWYFHNRSEHIILPYFFHNLPQTIETCNVDDDHEDDHNNHDHDYDDDDDDDDDDDNNDDKDDDEASDLLASSQGQDCNDIAR